MTVVNSKMAHDMVQRYFTRYNAGDLNGVLSLFADEAILEDPVGSVPVQGLASIRAFYQEFLKSKAYLRLAGPVRTTGSAIAFSFSALIGKGKDAMIASVVETWLLDDQGRIKEMRAFFDQGDMRPVPPKDGTSRKYEELPFFGQVALVTGGGSGIGQATAFEFARQGADVVVTGRRESACKETVGLIEAIGGRALAIPGDATDEAQVKAAVAGTLEAFGKLDHAVNTAGLSHTPTFLADLSLEQYEATLAANARSIFLCMKHQIKAMLASGNGGSIVNVTSDAAIGGLAMLSDYSAAKHAGTGLSRTAALEYARDGIRINSCAPGPVKTPMLDSIEGTEEPLRAMMLTGRIGRPEEIADTIVWLCSDRASFVYGQVLQVDGGLGGVSCVAPVTLPERSSGSGQ